MPEIDLRIEGLSAEPTGPDPLDEMPPALPGPAVSEPGDLWVLGRHRLLCGSALEPDAYAALMDGDQPSMVFTDPPPYNVPIQGHVSGLGAGQHREFAMAAGEMDEKGFTGFLTAACRNMAAQTRNGALLFICMDWRHMHELLSAGRAIGAELKNLCVWAKDNARMGSPYPSQHELVFVFKHGVGAHRNNVELGRHGRNRTNIWNYPGIGTLRRISEEGDLLALHPTVKPVALVADAIWTARRAAIWCSIRFSAAAPP